MAVGTRYHTGLDAAMACGHIPLASKRFMVFANVFPHSNEDECWPTRRYWLVILSETAFGNDGCGVDLDRPTGRNVSH